jgi:hypothetical protein
MILALSGHASPTTLGLGICHGFQRALNCAHLIGFLWLLRFLRFRRLSGKQATPKNYYTALF